MTARALDRRLSALEGRSGASPIVTVLTRDGLDRDAAVACWERENGPLGDSYLFLVNLVDARL